MFGYGVVVSDIAVTLGDGSQRDVLRKAYPVGRFIVAGFAGSARIGFDLLADLQRFLKMTEDEKREPRAWQPASVAHEWSARARNIFLRQPEEEKQHGAAVLMVGIQVKENFLGGGFPVVSVLESPDFKPVIEQGADNVMSIGSGTNQKEAMESLRRTVASFDLMQAEVNNPGGFGKMIAFGMTRDLFLGAPPGVSRHMHVTIVRLGKFSFAKNDMSMYPPDGDPVELRMPEVGNNYREMLELLGFKPDAAMGITARRIRSLQVSRLSTDNRCRSGRIPSLDEEDHRHSRDAAPPIGRPGR